MFDTVLFVIWIIARLYQFILIFSIILTWIPRSQDYAVFRTFDNIGGWYLNAFRGKYILGVFDLGVLIGLIIYEFILNFSFSF